MKLLRIKAGVIFKKVTLSHVLKTLEDDRE